MTGLDETLREGLGAHLRRLRQAEGLTLAALAEQVGVTASALSQIERGRSEPSLGTLWRLGRALNASLFDFFAGQEAPTVDVTRAADRTVVEFGRSRYEVMARSAQRSVDFFTLRLNPGDGPVRDPIGHAGEEAGVVLEGEMDVIVAGVAHRLGPRDAIWFVSSQPHTFVPVGDEPCLSIWTDTIPHHDEPAASGSLFAGITTETTANGDGPPATPRAGTQDQALAVARALPVEADRLRRTVEHLAAIGSSPLGFRTTGTPEDREAAAYVAAELRAAGLSDVAVEEVEVDGWRFAGARLLAEGLTVDGAALGGAPATPAGGVRGPLVDARGAERRVLDTLEVRGAIVLIEWRKGPASPCDVGLELGLRGAVGVVVTPADDGPFFQAEGALGAFDGHWHAEAPPMMTVRKADAAALRRRLADGRVEVTLEVRATVSPSTAGANAVGFLPGELDGPIVVGAHHDGWFGAAFDNATGVAVVLEIARTLAAIGYVPRHRICFTSRTGEEFGLLDRELDWCVGAWRQVAVTHPEWGEHAPFHLCVEASGHPELRLVLETPVELTRWARGAARVGESEGWLTSGWYTSPPVTGTEQWPFLVAGVPGVAAYNWEAAFARGIYHTPLDTAAVVDFDHLARLARFYAFLLVDADRDPDGILDHPARGRQLVKRAAALGAGGEALHEAATAHRTATGRAAFTPVGRGLHAVDAGGATGYPHDQVVADIKALEAARDALGAGDRRRAARALAKVGANVLFGHLSAEALELRARRLERQQGDDSWAARSHLTSSPVLAAELAALRAEPGARTPGPWIERAIDRHLERARADLDLRVRAMVRALEPPHPTGPQEVLT